MSATLSRGALVLGGGILLALASSLVQRTRPEVQDWDCPPSPASCARPVLVAGFPLAYLSDYHGISPVGSVDLVGAALGMDLFDPALFLANVAIWTVVLAAAAAAWPRTRRSREIEGSLSGSADR